MKLKSLLITTCMAATTLFIQSPLHAQGSPIPEADATPGAPPKFGPDSKPEHGGHGDPKGHKPMMNPEERITRMKEALSLTAEQEAKIREIFKTQGKKMKNEKKPENPTPEDRAKHEAARAEVEASVKAVLTPEQQTKWETMKQNRKEHGKPDGDKKVPKP